MNYNEALLVKIVWYYYFEEMTQQQIAEKLNISRMKVVKYLDTAKQNKIIQFSMNKDNSHRMINEETLKEKYNLDDIFIVPTTGNNQQAINKSIAKAAAMYINDRLDENRFINAGYGDTSNRVLNYLANIASPSVSFISLTGGVSYYLPNAQSNVFNATLNLIPTPLMVSSSKMRDQMLKEASVEAIYRMVPLAAFSVIGVGSLHDDATILRSNILTTNDFQLMKSQGIVGDIISHFFDKNGNVLNTFFEDRLISYPADRVRELNNVIGVVGGESKVEAIKAALKGGYIDILITDEFTAGRLI